MNRNSAFMDEIYGQEIEISRLIDSDLMSTSSSPNRKNKNLNILQTESASSRFIMSRYVLFPVSIAFITSVALILYWYY